MLQQGFLEYIFTIGILISFIAIIIGTIKDRKNILKAISDSGFKKRDIIFVILILLLFASIELYYIKATQLLFFDDAIYQAMALDLLHTGQAWMCNYGNAAACFNGQIFHEPIGLSFNIAIGFLLAGVTRGAGYGAEFALGILSVFMSFFASLLLLKNRKAALFTELLMALSPAILVWAMPTNSDLAALAYSLVAIFFLMLFIRKKNIWSISNMLFSFSLLFYMKVNEILFLPIFVIFYILLDDNKISNVVKSTFKNIKKNFLNTKLLIVLLFFIIAVVPSILYSFNESQTDSYGWQGTIIQNTCTTNLTPMSVNASINLQNFGANVCANVAFWFNQYKSTYIMQPILFTVLAILGAGLMLFQGKNRKVLAAIGIWFLAYFLLYTAFYAGSVIYGVDWRFMLSLIAQASILGGFAIAEILEMVSAYAKKIGKSGIINGIALVVVVIVLLAPIYLLLPLLSVSPVSIQQAGDARFYENFVYNNSKLIPNNCIVYTYDPTLFNLNNKTATQIDNLYNTTQVAQYRKQYSCLILDYGYWCHTPNNQCGYAQQNFNLTPIATATYNTLNYKYGFYIIK